MGKTSVQELEDLKQAQVALQARIDRESLAELRVRQAALDAKKAEEEAIKPRLAELERVEKVRTEAEEAQAAADHKRYVELCRQSRKLAHDNWLQIQQLLTTCQAIAALKREQQSLRGKYKDLGTDGVAGMLPLLPTAAISAPNAPVLLATWLQTINSYLDAYGEKPLG